MNLPKRKPNRLANYDYSQSGSYFVTICLKDRQPLLWAVGADRIRPGESPPLSACGELVRQSILAIPTCYPHAAVDGFVIMPNHIHMILTLSEDGGRIRSAPTGNLFTEEHGRMRSAPTGDLSTGESGRIRSAPTGDLSTIIGQTKRRVSRQVGCPFWQKSFHDHIIRNEQEYQKIAQYIATNPLTWETDCFFDENLIFPEKILEERTDSAFCGR